MLNSPFQDERDYPNGESMAYVEKHVEFTHATNEDDESMGKDHQQRLHRRDTPHHLKNKRVINKNDDGGTLDVSRSLSCPTPCFSHVDSFFSSKSCRRVQRRHHSRIKAKT